MPHVSMTLRFQWNIYELGLDLHDRHQRGKRGQTFKMSLTRPACRGVEMARWYCCRALNLCPGVKDRPSVEMVWETTMGD